MKAVDFIKIFSFLGVLALFTVANAEPICKATKAPIRTMGENQGRIDLNLNGHQVSIIGWEHQVSSQENTFNKATQEALANALRGKCDKANIILKNLMAENFDREQNSEFVVKQLSEIQRQFPIDAIVDEYSPEEMQIRENFRKQQEAYLATISQACPKTKEAVSRTRVIYPGPVYAFNHYLKQDSLPVLGMENQNLRLKAEKYIEYRYTVLSQMKTQGVPSDVPKKSRDLIRQILQKSIDKGYLDEQLLAQALKLISKDDIKKLIERFVRTTSGISETMHERDSAIVKKMTEAPGNYVLVYGGYHLESLRDKLLRACNAGHFISGTKASQNETQEYFNSTQ